MHVLLDGQPARAIDDDVTVRASVADGDGGVIAALELTEIEPEDPLACFWLFEVQLHLLHAARVLHFDQRIAGTVAVRRRSEHEAIFAGLGELRFKAQTTLAVLGVAVVTVAVADETLRGTAFLPVAGDFGFRVIHDDAFERLGFDAAR